MKRLSVIRPHVLLFGDAAQSIFTQHLPRLMRIAKASPLSSFPFGFALSSQPLAATNAVEAEIPVSGSE